MKRIIAIVLSLVMVLSFFACGKDTSKKDVVTKKDTVSTSEETKPQKRGIKEVSDIENLDEILDVFTNFILTQKGLEVDATKTFQDIESMPLVKNNKTFADFKKYLEGYVSDILIIRVYDIDSPGAPTVMEDENGFYYSMFTDQPDVKILRDTVKIEKNLSNGNYWMRAKVMRDSEEMILNFLLKDYGDKFCIMEYSFGDDDTQKLRGIFNVDYVVASYRALVIFHDVKDIIIPEDTVTTINHTLTRVDPEQYTTIEEIKDRFRDVFTSSLIDEIGYFTEGQDEAFCMYDGKLYATENVTQYTHRNRFYKDGQGDNFATSQLSIDEINDDGTIVATIPISDSDVWSICTFKYEGDGYKLADIDFDYPDYSDY